MAIPSRQIGWSTKANLLWEISKQLELMTQVAGSVYIAPQITGGWSVVTGGEAGDGTVAQYSPTGFNITGPDDNVNNGWVYIKKYFAQETNLTIDFQWASADDGSNVDWPIYCIDADEPTGEPSDLTVRVDGTPQTSTWSVSVPAGNWFSVGIYSDDTCCGRGFLSVDIAEQVVSNWAFIPAEYSAFPTSSDGYSLYEGPWTNYDDGQTSNTFPLAGEFYMGGTADSNAFLSTNGFMILANSGANIFGNEGDLFLTPGDGLDDGTTQNFWYQNYIGNGRWRTKILVYCGHCCGSPNQQTPYSYVINIYRDSQYQYIETCAKSNLGNSTGPDSATQPASTATQVWRSNLGGSDWTYLGYGFVEDPGPTVNIVSQELTFPISYVSMNLTCNGGGVGGWGYTSQTANDINELAGIFNSNTSTNIYGVFTPASNTVLQVNVSSLVKDQFCPSGTLGMNVFSD